MWWCTCSGCGCIGDLVIIVLLISIVILLVFSKFIISQSNCVILYFVLHSIYV